MIICRPISISNAFFQHLFFFHCLEIYDPIRGVHQVFPLAFNWSTTALVLLAHTYTWRHFRFFAFSHSPLQKSFSQKKFVQKRKNEKPDFLYRNCQKWTKNWRKVPKNVKKIFIFILFQSKLAQKQLYKKFWIKNWIPEIFWPFLTHL